MVPLFKIVRWIVGTYVHVSRQRVLTSLGVGFTVKDFMNGRLNPFPIKIKKKR
jgi:hypothetical protein